MTTENQVNRRALITGAFRPTKPEIKIIRPPGAVAQKSFFESCDGCGDCAEACPADAIIMQGPRQRNGDRSPEIRVNDNPCIMCVGLQCTSSCPTGALQPVVPETMHMGRIEFNASVCWASQGLDPGCNYCFDRCPLKGKAITYRQNVGPEINNDVCTGCGTCVYYCPSQPKALTLRPME